MKKVNKKDKIYLLLLSIIFISIIVYILRNNTLYGSILDWNNQHSVIPDYFRTLFYKTNSLFPNLALNLGSGQNIYNYSYYGLLSPIILVSYLLPFITMKTFIQVSSIMLVYSSILLFYYFLRLNKYNENISFVGTICFFASTPLLFHSHRHIMFMNYFPFLILALIGVLKYFENNNKKLLCISTLLIILTSYYYSIPSIFCIVIFGLYKYIQINKKITFKKFISDSFKFLLPIMCAVLMSSILLVPTFMTLLSGRDGSNVSINLMELLVPKINIKYIYSSYGLGLTSFSLIGILYSFKTKRKENTLLSIILSLMILFPIVNYILNATMYVDSKVLIPFIPLFILLEVELFNNINNKINIKYLLIGSIFILSYVFMFKTEYHFIFYIDYILSIIFIIVCNKFKLNKVFNIIVVTSLIILTFILSNNDSLVPYDRYYNDSNNNQKELTKLINNDYNHTTLYNNNHDNVNEIYNNLNIYSDYIYSSIGNKLYNKFYFDIFENNMSYRNRALLTANKNIMYLMFSNNKYIIGDDLNIIGFNKTNIIGNTSLYENDDVLPFMYVSYNFMNNNDFDKYSFPYNNEILLKNTIINSNVINNYISNIKEINKDEFKIKEIDSNIEINNNTINVSKKSKMIIDLDDLYKDKIIFISFNLESQNRDLAIDINGVTNKLTNKNWKYYNGNNTFNYVIGDKYKDNLIITINKGKYIISDLKIYYLDYNDIQDINKNVTRVNIDNKTIGDKIYANVNVEKDGYFVTTIPYDKGFTIKVDNNKIDYEIVNKAFVGFKINKGYHNVEISYRSPGKLIGIIFSSIGIVIYLIIRKGKQIVNIV